MKHNEIVDYLRVIDAEMAKYAKEGETLSLHLIGRSALILRYGLDLGTKDVDIVHFHGNELESKAVEMFGKGTPNADRLGFYLEPVPQGLPPIPGAYCPKSEDIPGDWQVIRPRLPRPHDLAVTKLSRFHAKDREDLQILCDSGELNVATLRKTLDSAFAFATDEDEDPKRKKAYANLRTVIEYLEGNRREL
jgi:Nucleotidyltransferase of unknown function (DUF6036)